MKTQKPLVFTGELLITEIPRDAIKDCACSGQNIEAVRYWINELNFSISAEKRGAIIKAIKEYGAWDLKELNKMNDQELAEIVFWLACGDFSEFISCCERDNVDPFSLAGQYFEANCGSSSFYLC